MSWETYISSEDSALLRSAVGRYSGERFLEIGAGNGGCLVEASEKFGVVVGTDLAEPSMGDWREGANFVLADLASCIRAESFDVVGFNPPYLKVEVSGDRAVEGGPRLEVAKRFLAEALRVVKKDGRILYLLSDEGAPEFEELCSARGFRVRKVGSKRMFFEELTVYEATPAAQALGQSGVSAPAHEVRV